MSRFECLNNKKETKKETFIKNSKNKKGKKSFMEKKSFEKIEIKKINIDDEKSFPNLCGNIIIKNSELNNYDKILKQEIFSEKEITTNIKPGWVILKKNNNIEFEKKNNTDYNEYYNPILSNKILDDRYFNRCELNEILGDRSEFWNMDNEYEYHTREDEEVNDEDSEESELEDFEDYYY